jgi:hypothetical protein
MIKKSAHRRGRYKKTTWTEADSVKLTELLKEKTRYKEIARILGKSRSACEGHAFRMGFTQSLKITDEEPLDEPIYTTRRCLYCLEDFQSVSSANRLCGPCKRNMDRHR